MNIWDVFEMLGVDVDQSSDPWPFIDRLIDSSTFSEEVKEDMHYHNNDDTPVEVMEVMLEQLFSNQRDNIDAGFGYNQSDIKRKLKRL